MTATSGADAVHQASALAALTAGRTTKGSDPDHTSFGDELSEAQHVSGSGTPVGRQHQNPQHPDRQARQAPERDVPHHPVLRGGASTAATASRRPSTPVAPKPVLLHPMATPDAAAAAALQAPVPAATLPVVPAKAVAATDASLSAASAASPAAPADAAAAPTAPAITALVAGSPSAPVAPVRQQPASDAAAKASPADAQQSADSSAGSPAAQAQSPAQPATEVQITVQTPVQTPVTAQPDPSATPAPGQVSADATAVVQPAGQHHAAAGAGPANPALPTDQPVATVATGGDRETTDQGPAQQQDHDQAPARGHTATLDAAPAGAPATPYSSPTDRTQVATTAAATPEAGTAQETPATQALPPGTLDQVNSAEHSVRVQVETQALGKVTAEMHTRPGEIGVHLSVPDDAGRALMSQRLDALRDSLGQGGSAVHLSLAAQGNDSQGQQSSTPREDRAPAQPAPQPHDAATPRATDGSPVTTAPADGTHLVDVHA